MSAVPFLHVFLSDDSQPVSSAFASLDWSITIKSVAVASGGTGFVDWSWEPTELNAEISVDDFAAKFDEDVFYDPATLLTAVSALSLSTTSATLTKDVIYSLTIDHSSAANATFVPIPGTLVLMGLGLILLGSMSNRRSLTA